MQLRWYQAEAKAKVYEYLNSNPGFNPCVVLPTGCHAAGHPILMHDGTVKPVECVKVGDRVMGADSKPRIVLSLCRGNDEMFLITPTKGESFVVNGDHILSLQCTSEGKKAKCPSHRRGGEIENISVQEYLSKSKSWKHLRKLYRVQIDFADTTNLPIPPYILGVLIGDGCLAHGVEVTTPDEEIRDELCRYAQMEGLIFTVKESANRCIAYRLTTNKGERNILSTKLDDLELAGKLSGEKHIPQCYLTASKQERLELLAGLMDTDGHLSRNHFDYITKSRELAADILYLARSVGLAAYETPKFCKCQTGASGWYYRISISGDCDQIPCRVKRKQATRRRQIKSVLRTGFKVEPIGKGEYFGFTLTGDHLYVDGSFTVHHNSGKTPLLAQICADVAGCGGRVLVLAHVKELLQQAADKLQSFLSPDMVGVYSAGLNSRDTKHPVICAGIQSVYKRSGELGAFTCIIIDECHLISPNDGTMYRTFLEHAKIVNPNVRIIGLTATPYRMDCGYICGENGILNEIAYEVGVKELIVQGFLCPIKTRAGKERANLDGVHIRGGEYVESEMAERMDVIVSEACAEVVELTKDRNSVLIFASSVKHGKHVQSEIARLTNEETGFVCGETSSTERAELLERFKGNASGLFGKPLKYLVNVNVLTTGFDAPNVDTVVLLRATLSPGLYYQMVGRGLRLHESKADCVVLDYGENTVRHGAIDAMIIKKPGEGEGEAPAKECPECLYVCYAGVARCPECGFEFPPPELKHTTKAGEAGVLSGEVTTTEYKVTSTSYFVHQKRNDPDKPTTMRVEYHTGWVHGESKREWLCFNHDGWAKQKAEQWWRDRSNVPVPVSTEEAVKLADAGALAKTKQIIWREVAGEKYGSIVGYDVDDHKPSMSDLEGDLAERERMKQEDLDEWGEPVGATVESTEDWFNDFKDEIPF